MSRSRTRGTSPPRREDSTLRPPEISKVSWRVMLSGPGRSPAVLEATLTPEGVGIVLRDCQGDPIDERWIDADVARSESGGRILLEWRSARRCEIRILLTSGHVPLVRSRLPESMGLPGGRYDLIGCHITSGLDHGPQDGFAGGLKKGITGELDRELASGFVAGRPS